MKTQSTKHKHPNKAQIVKNKKPDGRVCALCFRRSVLCLCFGSCVLWFRQKDGQAALTAVIFFLIISIAVAFGFSSIAIRESNIARTNFDGKRSYFLSEAGQEDAVYRIVTGKNISGEEVIAIGGHTATTTVAIVGDDRQITSVGSFSNAVRKIDSVLESNTSDIPFVYGAQVGDGGIDMENNATIQGSVYSNGNVLGDGDVVITGDVVAAGTSRIDNGMTINGNAQAYDIDDATIDGYASSTTELEDSTVGLDAHADEIDDSTIGQDAYYTTIDSSPVGGTEYPGNPGPANQPALSMPISDAVINGWKQDAQDAGVVASGDCSGEWSPPTDPYTINGGVIETDLVLDNNQTLVMAGTVWVQCNVDIDNGAEIQLASSYGAQSGVLIADGWMHLRNNGTFQGSGTSGSYLMLLSTATGGGHHDSAFDLHNNAAGAIFYAANGLINLHNNVTVTNVVADRLALDNNAEIIYEVGLADVQFSSGPAGGGFSIGSWKEIE